MARVPLLILNDWLRDPLSPSRARDRLEVIDDRYGRSSTLVATQVPVGDRETRFPDPTLGGAFSIVSLMIHISWSCGGNLCGNPNQHSYIKPAEYMISQPAPLSTLDWNRSPSSRGTAVHHCSEQVCVFFGIRS